MPGSVHTSNGDREKEPLTREAADILARWVNVETIGTALSDPDRDVPWWALLCFPSDPEDPAMGASLAPQLRRLATEGDAPIRELKA